MEDFWGPIQSLIIGVLIIVFRNKIAAFLEKAFAKFPQYREGAKALNFKYSVRPIFLTIVGVIYILLSINGFFVILTQ